MSHELDMSNRRANMAYIGEVPWHGLGFELKEGASIEEWRTVAGMDFSLKTSPVCFTNADEETEQFSGRNVLYRDDTKAPLAIASSDYKIVQPGEVLEFYRDIVSAAGFKLNTAGVLNGGRKYWALAETGDEARIFGQDAMRSYLLLATSCDGTLATRAAFTSVRVVCNNTLGFAVNETQKSAIRVPHSRTFNPAVVKAELGIVTPAWLNFVATSTALAERKVSDKEAVEWLVKVMGDASKPVEDQLNSSSKVMKRVYELFQGGGRGSDLRSAEGTAWGLVNAVTEYSDHHARAHSANNRLDNAWFGSGALLKAKAWSAATDLIAA